MTDELPVHVSRQEPRGLEVPPTVEVEGSFDVRFVNHGDSVYVHLHLDDGLSELGSIEASNHFVEGDSERIIRVDVDTDRLGDQPVTGKLKLSSAHGATTRWVDVELQKPEDENNTVEVDESLARPQPEESESGTLFDKPELLVLGLGAFALIVAASAAVIFDNVVVLIGSLLVLAGVLGAMFFLINSE